MKAPFFIKLLCPTIGLFISIPTVSAQNATSKQITLAEALQRAGNNNPAIVALQFSERAADGLIEQAGLRPNPTLDISAENFLGTGRVQSVRSLETTIQASQLIERGGKREKRVALATRGREIASKELAVLKAEILQTAATAYVELLAAQERRALLQEPLKLARSTLASVELRQRSGAASNAEVARAKAAMAVAQGECARADAAVTSAQTALAASWGGIPSAEEYATGQIQIPEVIPSLEDAQAKLLKHPLIAADQAGIEGMRAALELEKAGAKQDITVGGGVRFLRDGSDAAFVTGVSIPLAVRNKNQGNIRAARERVSGAEHKLRVTEATLRSRLIAAWQELNAAYVSANSLTRDVLPATQAAYESVNKSYEAGQLPLVNVLDAQRDLVSIQKEILESKAAYIAAMVRVSGLIDPSYTSVSIDIAKR